MKNKKGDILDILVLLVTLTVIAIGFFIFSYIVPQLTGGFNDAGLNNSQEGISAINHLENFGVVGIQRGFFLIFVGLIASIMVSSFFIRTHPIWIFVYIFVLAISIVLSVYFGNYYETLTATTAFASRLADQNYIHIVMNNIVKIILSVGVLSIVIIFSKFSFASGDGP